MGPCRMTSANTKTYNGSSKDIYRQVEVDTGRFLFGRKDLEKTFLDVTGSNLGEFHEGIDSIDVYLQV